jgi:external thioesterase TEII
MQLFLLHFAGGNCYSYDFLRKMLPVNVKAFSLELPGRGKRHGENLLYNKSDAIADYILQIKRFRNKEPYMIYGHSMGATLGLSVVNVLEESGDSPLALIVSGNPGPGVNKSEEVKSRYQMNDVDFKIELKKLGGLPDEVLENDDLYNFFSPILRADFELLEKDEFYEQNIKINTHVYAIMGDEERTAENISNWKNYTAGNFNSKILSGNHFFIYKHPKELTDIILNCSKSLINS